MIGLGDRFGVLNLTKTQLNLLEHNFMFYDYIWFKYFSFILYTTFRILVTSSVWWIFTLIKIFVTYNIKVYLVLAVYDIKYQFFGFGNFQLYVSVSTL